MNPSQQKAYAKARAERKRAQREKAKNAAPKPTLTRADLITDLFQTVLQVPAEGQAAIERRAAFLDFVDEHVGTWQPPLDDLLESLISYYTEADALILTSPEYESGSEIFEARLASARKYFKAIGGAA